MQLLSEGTRGRTVHKHANKQKLQLALSLSSAVASTITFSQTSTPPCSIVLSRQWSCLVGRDVFIVLQLQLYSTENVVLYYIWQPRKFYNLLVPPHLVVAIVHIIRPSCLGTEPKLSCKRAHTRCSGVGVHLAIRTDGKDKDVAYICMPRGPLEEKTLTRQINKHLYKRCLIKLQAAPGENDKLPAEYIN